MPIQVTAHQTKASFRGKLVQAANFGTPCVMALADSAVLLHKLDTTDDSCLVLPRSLTNRRHRFLCLLRAAQLPSQDCVCSPVLLVQCSRLHRSATSATVVFRGGEPAHRKVCRLACCACSHRGIGSALRSQYCRKSEYLKPRITTQAVCCRSCGSLS